MGNSRTDEHCYFLCRERILFLDVHAPVEFRIGYDLLMRYVLACNASDGVCVFAKLWHEKRRNPTEVSFLEILRRCTAQYSKHMLLLQRVLCIVAKHFCMLGFRHVYSRLMRFPCCPRVL